MFSNGKTVHFKKYEQFKTISGKSNESGAIFNLETLTVKWNGLVLKCKAPDKNNSYAWEALKGQIKYCDIERKMFPNGWHYYASIVISGNPPKKLKNTGTKTMGLDLGVSTIAAVTDDTAFLEELAPDKEKYNKAISEIQKAMDRSKRISNPDKFNDDGTVKKGSKKKWIYSNRYQKNKRRLKYIYRKKSAYIKQFHEILANRLIAESLYIITEDMNFAALKKKAKKTERSTKAVKVKSKAGIVKLVRKFKRKKRFGKSISNRCPSKFLSILERKCILYGGMVVKVNTIKFKASQYDHSDDTYIKVRLIDRDKKVGEYKVQRDLYSAYLLKNSNTELTKPNRKECIDGFEKFVQIQNALISELNSKGVSMKQCFGF